MSEALRRHALVITTSWPRGEGDAAGHFVVAEVNELVQEGHHVTVLAPGRDLEKPPGCRVISLGGDDLFQWPGALPRLEANPWRALHVAVVVRRARRHIRTLPPLDRVIAHWIMPSAWPILGWRAQPSAHGSFGGCLLRPGGSMECIAHGSDVRLLLRMPPSLRNYVLRQLCRTPLHFRFVSSALRNDLLTARHLPPELRRELEARSHIRPAAIELSSVPSRSEARRRLQLGAEDRLIVIASRLIAGKRVDVALAAAELIPRCRVVVLGSGPELTALGARFRDVTFIGQLPRSEALTWIRAADVMLSASELEGAPTAIREARALGVPVVATPAGDLVDWAQTDPDLWLC